MGLPGPRKKGQLYEEYMVREEPFYLSVKDEIPLFEAAYDAKIPVLLKGPTGCGKTRFVEHMAYRLGLRDHRVAKGGLPLITVACHEDLTASDLVGRYLLKGEETVWIDGPLTRAVMVGAICYLDEVVEARKDTTVLIHSLTDHRRILTIEKRSQALMADDDFLLVISYNPGYQSVLKDLKQSTRQRFISIEFDYPPRELEIQIIAQESGVALEVAGELAQLGEKIRNLRGHGLGEGVSTRLLIYAGQLIRRGIRERRACEIAIGATLTDEEELQRAIGEVIYTIFP
ncbi:MAG: CbbQ/NirQ/NorQ/GpvN family protein [Candidatus Tectomicrobia bacterium]|uniref:CbbQ/NirQ/NorQ/GpvN family protein n=1 Tax=Tectimicrobiota bacterium TaxID=2528274 RepID=A0A932CMA8_UNCTE|nr:CbbQ/NirQ/NorQ/GpvN family protein [Candidatus Tectomicrobia bacterium]